MKKKLTLQLVVLTLILFGLWQLQQVLPPALALTLAIGVLIFGIVFLVKAIRTKA